MLEEYLTTNVFAFFLVFTRLGTAFMVVPGFGEGFVSSRVRMGIALSVSFLVMQFVADRLPPEPTTIGALFLLLGGEIVIGLIMGGALRLAVSSLHVGGTIIAQQSGLAAAQFFDPAQMTQGAVTSSFLTIMGMTMIFVTDLHHLFLQGTYASYTLFPVGQLPPFGDIAFLVSDFVAGSFLLGFQISAPFLVYGLTFYIGVGLINRLMPQVQVFFVAMPLQLAAAFAVLGLTVGGSIMWFLAYYEEVLIRFLGA
ncbi:flagellar biosynthetic protein FliR [Sneathiella chinensis]|uniref:Flagellar biosynthetic protein FliR n=1 Tax=Sneathiella chinensis TaxID=349750 RepID=A0ABQ5U814_9PROT|nr:flagellar biosynthetic protein FliR [Sneathiella chinensis]GLQ07330.1 flagellar biosynthetic protein FliR [Sneathiella chinensis]